MSLPILDLNGINISDSTCEATQKVVDALRGAATNSGFFYLINHGIKEEIVDNQFILAEQLFNLPQNIKEKYDVRNSYSYRGFEKIYSQQLDPDAKPDLKEGFYCGKNYAEDHPYVMARYQNYGPNQWPEELPQCEVVCLEYIDKMHKLANLLMQLLALSLSLPKDYFEYCQKDPMVTLRMLRYPSHPKDADQQTFGAGAHTDWGAVTILAQDELGGLEVRMPDGNWIAATPIKGAFVVNLGDMIPKWTNGLYHSNPHRVRNMFSNGSHRYSIPFFYELDYEANIYPVPGSVKKGEQPLFPPCTVGEHVKEMYNKTYKAKSA